MPSKPNRRRCALALGLGLVACREPVSSEGACLSPGRPVEEATEIPLLDLAPEAPPWASALTWYCEEPPPEALLHGTYRSELIWVDGEECDPCDLERIASLALPQVCHGAGPPTLRLLCGPIPVSLHSWQRKGCVYAVATMNNCIVD